MINDTTNNNEGRELGWDDELDVNAGSNFEVLPEGEYDFVVKRLRRAATVRRPARSSHRATWSKSSLTSMVARLITRCSCTAAVRACCARSSRPSAHARTASG